MTITETIKCLQSYSDLIDEIFLYIRHIDPDFDGPELDLSETLKNALNEARQYHKIGTIDECRDAVNKQKPMHPDRTGSDEQDAYTCPNCGAEICRLDDYDELHPNYCPDCGQALKWRSKT